MLFSYNTCVDNVWQHVKDAAARHSEPGKFIAFAGFECGTPPDDSHRCAYFPHADSVPPIFCETRPPAQDALLHGRFHPDTIHCRTLDEFYATVERFGGFVGGHFHTTTYDRELLAEIWQKQQKSAPEEQRLFSLLKQGFRFGVIGGSDTHDSMPGNPAPEPGCPRPAGFTGVWADELTVDALVDAFRARRVFATSGARIVVNFDADGQPMGSILPRSATRHFTIDIDAPAPLTAVELLRDGDTIHTWHPDRRTCTLEFEDRESSGNDTSYLVRATQNDGHRAWSSPIWFSEGT